MKTTRNMVYFILLMSSIGWGQDCDENMYWSDCGVPFYCNSTCLNPDPLPECDDYCEIGCFCNGGYIFSDDTYSQCILLEDCEEECPDSIEGDLNYDGIVNILDVVTLVTCILSDNRCDICFDINYDGEINVVDIISLVNIILDI